MRYHLLLKEFPGWKDADMSEVNRIILQFPSIYSEIESHLTFPGRFSLYRKVQKHAAAFDVLHEIVKQKSKDILASFSDQNTFEEKVREVCQAKYRQIRQRVSTGIVRSIIYIFVTKVFIAILIEIPYEIFVFEEIRYLPLSLNVIIPPAMMWMIGFSIRVPGAKNTETIVERLKSVVYEKEEEVKIKLSILKLGKNSTLATFFAVIYSIIFVFVFGSLTYLLTLINFTFLGILVFFGFLSLVVLFAFRVRYNANQMKVDSDSEGLGGHLTSYLMLPFLNFGVYLSKGLSKINFLTVLLDFLIEVPLKNMIEIFEEWTSFLREKKEEVVEMPE